MGRQVSPICFRVDFASSLRDVAKEHEDNEEELDVGRWVGTTTAAAYLGVVPRTLYRMIDEGEIPAYRMGRVIRLKRTDLDLYLENHRVEPGSLEHLYPPREPGSDK